MRVLTPSVAARFGDGALDFVYLDARHDCPSVVQDLHAWYPTLRRGGILAGHDYLDGSTIAPSSGSGRR